MNNIWIKIKKFFSIIFTFIFGIFFDNAVTENKNKESHKKDSNEKTSNIHRKEIPKYSVDRDDADSLYKDSNKYYTKEDIHKLFLIKKRIEKIQMIIKSNPDDYVLNELKKEIDSIKDEVEFLEVKYKKIDTPTVKEVKDKIEDCNDAIKDTENTIEKILDNNKDKDKDNDTIVEKNIPVVNMEKSEERQTKIVPKSHDNKDIKVNKEFNQTPIEPINKTESPKTKKVEKQPEKKVDIPKEIINTTILSSIIIKNINRDSTKNITNDTKDLNIEINKVDLNEEKTININKADINKEKNISKPEKKPVKVFKTGKNTYRKIKKNPKDLTTIKRRIAALKANNKINKISKSIKKALKLSMMLSLLGFGYNNINNKLATNLVINNHIRKARKVNNKKVKPLKYGTLDKKVSTTASIEEKTNYVTNDTLSQIRSLKQELCNIKGQDQEILKLLEELEQIEQNIMQNLQEEKQMNRSR